MSREPLKAPCKEACPAGVDVPRYLRFIASGRYPEALAVIRESIPFPAVCGYVCPAPCEIKCQLSHVANAPEAIRTLKRFVADQALGEHLPSGRTLSTGKRVAIVGSGPAGLTAAYYLARSGHRPTVFEALPEPGGMMRLGIPAYRLPRDILTAEIDQIRKAGVELKTDTRVELLDGLFAEGYDAVFLALGAHRGVRIGIAGEDSRGVIDALSFLRQVSLGQCPTVGKTVAVVGGGNSAVDAARTSLRLGAEEVTIVYRRTRVDMRAYPEEINEALREGVNMVFLATPSRIVAEGSGLKMECLRTMPGRKATDGPPEPIEGSEFEVGAQVVIVAVGQEPEIPRAFSSLVKDKRIQITPDTMETARTGVFAGADCVTGPSSVIEAVAAGRQAAIAIDRYLGGRGVIKETLVPFEHGVVPVEEMYPTPTAVRNEIPLLSITKRFSGFPLVELSLSPEIAAAEAKRCLGCDLPIVVDEGKCASCFVCQLVCSLRFEGALDTSKAAINILPVPTSGAEVSNRISFTDRCDNCGLCVRYCPFGALSRQHEGRAKNEN